MSAPWFKFNPKLFLEGVTEMSVDERGAYITVLALIYQRAGALPDDARWLAGCCRMSVRAWRAMRAALIEKEKLFVTAEGRLMNDRALFELEKLAKVGDNSGETSAKVQDNSAETEGEVNKNKDLPSWSGESGSAKSAPKKKEERRKRRQEDADASLSTAVDRPPAYAPLFEEAWRAYPHVKGRSSKPKAAQCWKRLTAEQRTALPAAVTRYAKEGREPKADCGAPAMDRWLRDQKFADWMQAPATATAATAPDLPKWTGPPEVRDAIVAKQGEAWSSTWLDQCRWQDLPTKAVVAARDLTRQRLDLYVGHILEKMGVKIILEEKDAA